MVFGLVPLLTIQTVQLAQQLPSMLNQGVDLFMALPEKYPTFITEEQLTLIFGQISSEAIKYGQGLLSFSAASLLNIVALIVYLLLVPMMVFFFLMDKKDIVNWFASFLPSSRQLTTEVWVTVNLQIANYVRGKIWEILIVWVACFIAFSLLGLNYAMLLSFLVGLSVLVPYVGATVVTIPVLLVAYVQWNWGNEFVYLMTIFLIIQALDGYVLVPLLFSEVVNLHPVAIIVAILFFGGVWGFWGVFFAIPLATLVQAVMVAWPKEKEAEIN
jgi:putative permease